MIISAFEDCIKRKIFSAEYLYLIGRTKQRIKFRNIFNCLKFKSRTTNWKLQIWYSNNFSVCCRIKYPNWRRNEFQGVDKHNAEVYELDCELIIINNFYTPWYNIICFQHVFSQAKCLFDLKFYMGSIVNICPLNYYKWMHVVEVTSTPHSLIKAFFYFKYSLH